MSRCVGVLLLLVCCYAAGTAGQQPGGAEEETWACGKSIFLTCQRQFESLELPPIATVLTSCIRFQKLRWCVTRTLWNNCSEDARQLIQLATGTLRYAAENALYFVCRQHNDEFERLRMCASGKPPSEVSATVNRVYACRLANPSSPAMIPDFCQMLNVGFVAEQFSLTYWTPGTSSSLGEQNECVGEAIGDLCGPEAESLVKQLMSNAINDLGCSDNDELNEFKRKGLDHVVGLISRALDN